MFVLQLVTLLVTAVSLALCLDNDAGRHQRYSVCEECRDRELMVAPGIGFDLTHGYGTAAVRFQNGSTVFLGKVEGDEAFIKLMMHLSNESSRPKRPENVLEKLRDAWERAKRQRNKSRGLPATEDVGTIANVVVALRTKADRHLGYNISAAVTAVPTLPGLTTEDLEDAMEYAGLKMPRGYNYYGDVREEAAAYAGLGNGLCQHPEDIISCEEENMNAAYHHVLSISFTHYVFCLKFSVCAGSGQCWEYVTEDHFNLGLRFKNRHGEEWRYWTDIRRLIRRFAELYSNIDRLQLFGEAASNEHFLEAVRGALRDLEPRETIASGGLERFEPLSLVAKGAAELAKRFQVMTWNCVKPVSCNETEGIEMPAADL